MSGSEGQALGIGFRILLTYLKGGFALFVIVGMMSLAYAAIEGAPQGWSTALGVAGMRGLMAGGWAFGGFLLLSLLIPLLRGGAGIADPSSYYVYVEEDGSARALTADEAFHLGETFHPADGGRPYIKNSYKALTPDRSISGFLPRDKLPARVNVKT
ncbi:MAG: hypothetical protein KKC14_11740 [Alphaproteobacteria bacterium]|nr:hypothetical protein [Alphaproteobacteria bacterium]